MSVSPDSLHTEVELLRKRVAELETQIADSANLSSAMLHLRERVKEKIRKRYRMDEALMEKDRLAAAIADVSSITSDLRFELDASPTGLQPFLAHDPV